MTAAEERDELLVRLRAISDPVRIDIIDALMAGASATRTELGRMVPVAKGGMRWHLKKLEEAGFIVAVPGTDPEEWAATRMPVAWSADEVDPEVVRAVAEFDRVRTDRRRRRLADWADQRYERPWAGTAWPEASISRDWVIPGATVEDLERLDQRITQVIGEFREQVQAAENDGGETIFLTVGAFPWRPPKR